MSYSFQIDSDVIKTEYNNNNYLIELDEAQPDGYCAIYFSSHDIYFPNTEEAFRQRVIKKNFFEWYRTRFPGVRKHIYLRDIKKQWYLSGVNSSINSPSAILDFLKAETRGLKILVIGSSAGGYAATLFGNLLGAERIINFNGQSDLNVFLRDSTESENPLLFQLQKSELSAYYRLSSILPTISPETFYFYSDKSAQDLLHFHSLKSTSATTIAFNTSHHGIPFLKCALEEILSKTNAELKQLSRKRHHPLYFSIQQSGLLTVSKFLLNLVIQQVIRRLNKGMRT
ncbi:MAG: hypothetical protein RL173_873 [Fibrobacterota bacterium]|jgi:hypothetical protein